MIRVLNIISDSNIGGAGRVLLNYGRCCDRTAFDTSVALPRGSLLKPPLEALDIRVYEVDGLAERSYHRDDVKTLTQLIRSADPDLVHTHGALSGRIAGKRCGKPVVYTRHSAFPVPARLRYPPGRWLNRWLNEHYADRIIAVSPAAAENLTDAGVPPRRITVMMNGVSPLERVSPQRRAQLRAQWGVEEGDFALGILARIEPYKGHLHILEAMQLLRAQGRPVKLLIAGTGSYEEELRREAADRGLEGQVRFLGFQSNVADFLSALDLQLNASYGTETSSLSVLEGLSIGLPAVVSSYGGNPWLISDGEDGLIFPNRDSAALARCVARLMDDRSELAGMRTRAKEIFRQRFTGEIFAQNVEAVYRAVLEERRHGI